MRHEHIGVRHMVWEKYLGKIRHLEDRMLFDVIEGKNFNYWLKGRVTSEIVVIPHKNGKETQRCLENVTNVKHVNEFLNCYMLNVKYEERILPQIDDDITIQRLDQPPKRVVIIFY